MTSSSNVPDPVAQAAARLAPAPVVAIEEVRKGVQEWVSKPGPMIIDSRISKAVINLPMRRVLYGKDE